MAAIQETGTAGTPILVARSSYHFPRLKEHLRGEKFEDDSAVMAAIEAFLESQYKDFFKKGI